MKILFSPLPEDWRELLRVAPRSGWHTFQFLISFVPLFLMGSFLRAEGLATAGLISLVLSIGIALASYEAPRVLQRRLVRTAPSANDERLLTVNNNGISATLSFSNAEYQWQAFTRYRETKAVFALFASPYQVAMWIPKRAMSQAQIEELRGLLAARLSRI